MIPDVLISKYLDGELSVEEDVEFRALLGADPEAREAFDSAVLMHIAMRCEDDTAVPADVNERVLAFIDSTPMYAQSARVEYTVIPDPSPAPYQSHRPGVSASYSTSSIRGLKTRGTQVRRAMAAAALLLVLALPFGEQFLSPLNGLVRIDSASTERITVQTQPSYSSRVQDTRIGKTGSQLPSDVVGVESTAVPQPLLANMMQVVVEDRTVTVESDGVNESATQHFESVTPSLHSLFASTDLPVAANPAPSSAKPTIMLADEPAIDVLVTTSFAQSVTAPTEGAVTTVAAGIGYGVADNTFVGMELGSTQYTRTNETEGLVEDAGSKKITDVPSSRPARPDHIGGLTKVTFQPTPSPQYRTEVHTSLSGEGTLWGAAFVQHSLLKTGMVSINGRLGAGVGEDGMLTYGRMQAECNLFAGVSLTVGAEARYSPFRTGVVGGQPMARSYGTVISALYGLQVRL